MTLGSSAPTPTGTIVPKGQKPTGSVGNCEIFMVKKIQGHWKFYRLHFRRQGPQVILTMYLNASFP